jgi:hypothetical protein
MSSPSRMSLLLLLGAAIVLSTAFSRMSAQTASAPSPKVVTISMDKEGNPQVDKDPVDLYKANGDSVQWSSDSSLDFVVMFDKPEGTPFADDAGAPQVLFTKTNNRSKKIIVTPPKGQTTTYRYSIYLSNGHKKDPGIIIH